MIRGLSGTDARTRRRPRGHNEFIEFYNATTSPITVNTTDGSGLPLVAADGATRSSSERDDDSARGPLPRRQHERLLIPKSRPGDLSCCRRRDAGRRLHRRHSDGAASLSSHRHPRQLHPRNRLDAAGLRRNPSLYFETTAPRRRREMRATLITDSSPTSAQVSRETRNNNAADFIGVQTSRTARRSDRTGRVSRRTGAGESLQPDRAAYVADCSGTD